MKIHLIGGAGSGKSYIAKKLSKKLAIIHYELDDIFWLNSIDGFGNKANPEIRDEQLDNILKNDNWIIEGVYYSWLDKSFNEADYIILLIPNILIQQYRIIKRFILRKIGIEKSNKRETFKNLVRLIKWNRKFNNVNIKEIEKKLKEHSDKLIVFRKSKKAYDEINVILKIKEI